MEKLAIFGDVCGQKSLINCAWTMYISLTNDTHQCIGLFVSGYQWNVCVTTARHAWYVCYLVSDLHGSGKFLVSNHYWSTHMSHIIRIRTTAKDTCITLNGAQSRISVCDKNFWAAQKLESRKNPIPRTSTDNYWCFLTEKIMNYAQHWWIPHESKFMRNSCINHKFWLCDWALNSISPCGN